MRIEFEKTMRLPRWAIWPVVFGGIWLALAAAVQFLYRGHGAHVVLCPLKRVVGLPCPTCGATRSALSFLSGNVADAVLYNPLVFAAGAVLFVVLLIRLVFARQVRVYVRGRQRLAACVLLAAVLLGNWIYVIRMGR